MRTAVSLAGLLALAALGALAQGPIFVINYSGFGPLNPVAPGSIASVYGAFGPVTTTAWNAANPPMPSEIATVSVRVNGVAAPLYFVSSGQINFNVPVATPEGRQPVEVVVAGSIVGRGTVNVWAQFPALAAGNTTQPPPGVILNQDNSPNGTTPAARGSVIQLFATGCGATNPAAVDGRPSGGAAPTVGRVTAWVDAFEAAVQYAGAQPQFPGVCQVNITIPDRPQITGVVPVQIAVNGIASNPVTVRVQ
jgi:uncharacterized protein (TIGR03437 family)